jgi:putative MATE family efflux protein
MDRAQRLGEEPIAPLLLKFAAPAIVGLMAQALYITIDRIFVGRAINEDALSSLAVAFPLMLLLMALGMLVGFGAAALISIRLGEQRKPDAEQVLGNATVLLLAAAVVSTLVGLTTLDPLLKLFGAAAPARAAILPYARDYMRIIVLGSVFQIMGFGLNAMIRGEGNPKIAMLTMLISVLLNIVLAPIFLFAFHWGMPGAALATVSAQAVSAVWVLAYFLRSNSLLRLRARNLRLRWSVCGRLLAIGSAPCAMQVANSAVHSVINHQLNSYNGELAIWGIIFPIYMLIFMPVIGINQGAQPIIGYNYGSLRFDRVKKTLQTAVLAASCIAVLGFVVMMVFPARVFRLFSEDRELIAAGVHAMRLCAAMLPLVGFQIVSSGYFQAVGKPIQAMILTLSRQVLLLIPAVLILPLFFRLDGVWMSLPVADLGSSLLTGLCLLLELRHLQRRHVETAAPDFVSAVASEI